MYCYFVQPHPQDEIRGKKPYTPVKSTVEPRKLRLDANSEKENEEPKSRPFHSVIYKASDVSHPLDPNSEVRT